MHQCCPHQQYQLLVTVIAQIYNEMIRDLLNPKSGILDLRDDSNGETMVAGLTEVEMTSTPEVMQLLNKGNLLRTCEPTAANHTSSRSHAILKVTVEQRSRTMDVSQEVRTGKLFMVDLAGSERAAVTKVSAAIPTSSS